jgi:hypothetical protein
MCYLECQAAVKAGELVTVPPRESQLRWSATRPSPQAVREEAASRQPNLDDLYDENLMTVELRAYVDQVLSGKLKPEQYEVSPARLRCHASLCQPCSRCVSCAPTVSAVQPQHPIGRLASLSSTSSVEAASAVYGRLAGTRGRGRHDHLLDRQPRHRWRL